MNKDSKITVHYFNGRGRGELARYILTHSKKEFTDRRIERADWPAAKPGMPLGQVPVVEFTDKDGKSHMLCQSNTIVRSLATIFGLNGKTIDQTIRADEAYESLNEVFNAASRAMFEQDAAQKEKLLTAMKTELIPRIMAFLEKRAKENGGKSLAGGEGITYADLTLASMFDTMAMNPAFGDFAKVQEMVPTLAAIAKSINESDPIKSYLAKRPKTEW